MVVEHCHYSSGQVESPQKAKMPKTQNSINGEKEWNPMKSPMECRKWRNEERAPGQVTEKQNPPKTEECFTLETHTHFLTREVCLKYFSSLPATQSPRKRNFSSRNAEPVQPENHAASLW